VRITTQYLWPATTGMPTESTACASAQHDPMGGRLVKLHTLSAVPGTPALSL